MAAPDLPSPPFLGLWQSVERKAEEARGEAALKGKELVAALHTRWKALLSVERVPFEAQVRLLQTASDCFVLAASDSF